MPGSADYGAVHSLQKHTMVKDTTKSTKREEP